MVDPILQQRVAKRLAEHIANGGGLAGDWAGLAQVAIDEVAKTVSFVAIGQPADPFIVLTLGRDGTYRLVTRTATALVARQMAEKYLAGQGDGEVWIAEIKNGVQVS